MMPPKAEPGTTPIIIEVQFAVTPESVYRAWTDPTHVKRWFGSQHGDLHDAAVDLQPGGQWRFTEQMNDSGSVGFCGEYIDIVPNECLVFTWAKFSIDVAGRSSVSPQSQVKITMIGTATGTTMRIVHSRLDAATAAGFTAGWESGTARLTSYLEP